MKSKLFSFITVSLAASTLLVPAQKASGFGPDAQTNLKETKPLVHESGSGLGANRKGEQNQGLVQESKATKTKQTHPTHPVAATSQTVNSSQLISVDQTAQVNNNINTVGGLFVTFLFIGYILVGLQYRKYRAHRATVLLQQIETLERIWKMKPQQR